MSPSVIAYDYSWAASLAFLSVVIFLLYLSLYRYRTKVLRRFGIEKILQAVVIPRSQLIFWTKVSLLCFTWILGVIALMMPKGEGRYLEEVKGASMLKQRPPHDVIFLVDASASMSTKDMRTGQSRLDIAKEIVEETVRDLAGQNVALYAFTSDTTLLSPPTQDTLFVRMMARGLTINEGDSAGTDLYQALSRIIQDEFSKNRQKLRSLVLITDGGDTKLDGPFAQQKENEILKLISNLNFSNLKLFVVGVGSKKGGVIPDISDQGRHVESKLEELFLQKIAKKGAGSYFFADRISVPVLARSLTKAIEKREANFKVRGAEGDAKNLVYKDYFQYPLFLALILFGLVLFFPDTRKKL